MITLVRENEKLYKMNYVDMIANNCINLNDIDELVCDLDVKNYDELMELDELIYSDENLHSIVEVFTESGIDIIDLYKKCCMLYEGYLLYYVEGMNQYYLFHTVS